MLNYTHLIWIVYGSITGFASSYIFGDLIDLPVDIYYLIYFTIVSSFLFYYCRKTGLNIKMWVRRRGIWAIIFGLLFSVIMIRNVQSRPETEQLAGVYLIWSVFWRGLVYGLIDGFLLTVFPWIVTWRAFNAENKTLIKKIAAGAVAWLFILLMSTGYHLGYSDFRSGKVVQANIGNTIMSMPTLLTANPVATPITHAALHISAVIHSPETELFLPPHKKH